MNRRVVVTGLGMVTPLGAGVDVNWRKMMAGESGITTIKTFDVSDLASKVAGIVPRLPEGIDPANAPEGTFLPDIHLPVKEQRKMDTFMIYGYCAAMEAIANSGYVADTDEKQWRSGVLIGSGIGGLEGITNAQIFIQEKGLKRISPFFIPSCLINLVSGHVSIAHGFKGPNHAVVTACSTGAHAIGDAARLIMWDDADVMVAGGAEAAVTPLGVGGFVAARAMSTKYNDTPTVASRPYDKGRDGFVIAEGAGAVVLEELEHAKARGATIYGEIVGYGLSGDAYHITSPPEDGNGAYRCMQSALRNAKLNMESIDVINAHGTSTPVGDLIEVRAMKRLFGEHAKNISMSSTKSSTGHLLGAAGAVEAIYGLLSIRDQVVPATLNLEDPEEETAGLDLVPKIPKQRKIDYLLSNSFGFGGTNASLIFKRFTD